MTYFPDGTMDMKIVDGKPDYKIIKEAIGGGMLELVPYWDLIPTMTGEFVQCVVFCDENGKDRYEPEMSFNKRATIAWYHCLSVVGITPCQVNHDTLHGRVAVLIGDAEFIKEARR
jgi:hypothetical protein